jgi:hypothetical protein
MDTGEIRNGRLELTGPLVVIYMHEFGTIRIVPHFFKVRCFENRDTSVEFSLPATTPGQHEPHVAFDDGHVEPEKALCMPINLVLWGPADAGYYLKEIMFVEVKETEQYRRVGFFSANIATKEAAV